MEEEKGGSKGGAENGESTRNSPSLIAVGGRERFTVELKPGETTIVSWKKLSKDPSKANGFTPALEPPSNAQAVLESRIAPGQPAENEAKDAPPANRFSAVVEKIERLYMGKHSSDEEDLNDVPDDDEYDTQDSFIDDRELDEYFQVDNSAIKHDGFFVNRGKLERVEMASLPHEQLKKRRRKDLTKGRGDNDDGRVRNKHAKVGKEAAGGSLPLAGKNSSRPSYGMGAQLPNEHYEDGKFQNQENASVICSKKTHSDTKTTLDRPPKVSNAAVTLSQVVEKDVDKRKTEKQKTGLVPSKSQGNKVKDVFESFDPSHQRLHDKSSYAQCKSQSGRLFNNVDNLEQTIHRKEKNDIREHPDINVSKGKYSTQTSWVPAIQRKATSGVRPKAKILEKAIRELENTVAESRPPTTEVPDADVSSQAVKRRLPHEVKQKLAKVARLAANHGKMSEELIDRLMNILGHLIQLRTLKRNLKVMVKMGLSAKQEKDNRFQQIKKEVIEMIKMQVLSSNSKALVKQSGSSDDFQEIGNEKKEVKLKCSMDDAMEEKICDLYDLYVEGLEEHSGPQVRKLYVELAELWPSGLMDNHGIKRAICRAKDRKRALYLRHKDQEKVKTKKLLTPKTDETVHLGASSTAMPQHMQEKLVTDTGIHGLTSLNKPPPYTDTASTTVHMLTTSTNAPNLDRQKQEKVKGSSNNSNDARTTDSETKKKVKRKPELQLTSALGEERRKFQKQAVASLQKPNQQSAPPSRFEPHS